MDGRRTRRDFLVGMSVAPAAFLCSADSGFADVGGAEAAAKGSIQREDLAFYAAKRSRVIAACMKHWPDNQGDCAFVRAVARDLGFVLNGTTANDIYGQIAKSPWVRIGIGTQASVTAGVTAGEGDFVVAAEPGPIHYSTIYQGERTHVAIVVDYRNAFDSYSQVDRDKALAFWGKLNSVGEEYQKITYLWTPRSCCAAADFQRVLFAYQPIS